ncbi:MAG: hypothetical protein MUO21_11350 [Nitrososphaeraceae archaeon]|nr:hypothetical protein [Nitrososphaeraceae archaeon]
MSDKKNNYFIRKLEFFEIPQIIRLNKISRKKFFLYCNRSREIWERQEQNRWQADWPFQTYVVTENECIKAYFRMGIIKDKVVLIEISDTNDVMSEAILGFIKDLGFNKGVNVLVSRINHNEFFSKYLVSKGGKMNSPYAWQVKVVNYANFFKKIIPKFNDRLSSSSFTLLNNELKLNFFKTSVILKIKNAKFLKLKKEQEKKEVKYNLISLYLQKYY